MKHETIDVTAPSLAIVHFKNEEGRESQGGSVAYYQVTIDPNNPDLYSPSTDYIRFGNVQGDEIQGWKPMGNIVIDEILMEYQEAVPYKNLKKAA